MCIHELFEEWCVMVNFVIDKVLDTLVTVGCFILKIDPSELDMEPKS